MVTTAELQAEEDYVVGFAARGQGSVRPVGLSAELERGKLNDGQWDTVTGLLESQNRVNLVQGPAGAGKSSMLGKFDEGLRRAGQSATYLATTAKAAEVLQKDGFEANTLARFLVDEKMQAAAKGGRVVVDEISMLGHKDADRLFRLAERLNLKLILVGDPMQHGSVGRGATMRLLTEYGGVQPFRLTEILRQEDPAYRAAAKLLSEGQAVEGFDALDGMGWVKEMDDDADRYAAIAADYLQGDRRRRIGAGGQPDALPKRPHHRRDPLPAPRGGQARRGARIHPPGAGRCIRGRTRPGQHLPAGRRPPVPPERQGRL